MEITGMTSEFDYMLKRAARGLMSRREFVGRASALGITASTANMLLSSAARAQEPVKGGVLRAGMAGGESTNSLDPALPRLRKCRSW
jgi:peptide/nickel transport system substrate-binding protein